MKRVFLFPPLMYPSRPPRKIMGRRVSEYKGKGSGYHSDLGQPGRQRTPVYSVARILSRSCGKQRRRSIREFDQIYWYLWNGGTRNGIYNMCPAHHHFRLTKSDRYLGGGYAYRRAPGTENCMGRGPLRGTNILRAWEMVLEGKAFAKKTAVWEPRKMPGTSCAEGVPGGRFWSKTPTEIGCAFDRNRSET
jgi:hypothetical protein